MSFIILLLFVVFTFVVFALVYSALLGLLTISCPRCRFSVFCYLPSYSFRVFVLRLSSYLLPSFTIFVVVLFYSVILLLCRFWVGYFALLSFLKISGPCCRLLVFSLYWLFVAISYASSILSFYYNVAAFNFWTCKLF